ncbi:MAG: hypothetical protein V4538_15735 [Bacteroidota bacterium]
MDELEFDKIKFNKNTLINYTYTDKYPPILCSVSYVNFTEIILELIPIDDPYHRSEKFVANIKHCAIYKKDTKKIINLR